MYICIQPPPLFASNRCCSGYLCGCSALLHYCSLISPSLHKHTHTHEHRSQQGLSLCHTSKSCVPYATVGSWQAGVSLLPVSWEPGSKANEGPSGTVLPAHSAVVAGARRSISWLTLTGCEFENDLHAFFFLQTDARLYHRIITRNNPQSQGI